MNSYNLRCFVAVAESLNITKASEKLFMSQQNLSNHIARLEEELGSKLFERKPSLRLTYAGECTLETARLLLHEEDELARRLDDISEERRARLRIGATKTRGSILVSEVAPFYHQRFPSVDFRIRLGNQKNLLESLERGELDIMVGMGVLSNVPDFISTVSLYRTRLCLLAPLSVMQEYAPELLPDTLPEDGIITTEPIKDIGGLRQADFLLHYEYNVIRDLGDSYFKKYNITPRVLLEINNLEKLHELCCAGMGVTFSFESYARKWHSFRTPESRSQPICILPLDEEDFESEFIIGYNKRFYFSKAAENFIKVARELYQ